MNTDVPAAEIKWLRDTNSVQLLAWVKSRERFDAWLVIPVLPSVGGGAGIFAAPSLIDPDQSSPVLGLMSMDPAMENSRKKVNAVLLEIPKEEWSDLLVWEDFLRGAGEDLRREARTFGGNVPRATSLRAALGERAFCRVDTQFAAETEEGRYMTADKPPGLASQPSLQKRGGGDVLAEAQAAARRQQAPSGVDRQHAAHSALANAARESQVSGRLFAKFKGLDTDRRGRRQRDHATKLQNRLGDGPRAYLKRMDQGSPSRSLLTPHAGWLQQMATGTNNGLPYQMGHLDAGGS